MGLFGVRTCGHSVFEIMTLLQDRNSYVVIIMVTDNTSVFLLVMDSCL